MPICKHRSAILGALGQVRILIIIGETGSGKSTQIPQYVAESHSGCDIFVACTQPRRVAAVSISNRVAQEVGCRQGIQLGLMTVRARAL